MIVIIYAHPYPRHSRANSALLDALDGMEKVRVRSLYELYPDFSIDVAAEQEALAQARLVVWQHPLHWYGAPALFRLWMDKVLQYGWAYGKGAGMLDGKDLMWTVTTGGDEGNFSCCGENHLGMLGQPLRSAGEQCGMRWLAPYSLHGVTTLTQDQLAGAGVRYREQFEALLRQYEGTEPATGADHE
ncbi:glutathione-regulated potassium-efflux system oxidoreductase KefF [Bordetella sp. N]|uniref:glutathione-regulated potassium-efflux system oxidoreductase KefF n=1 Tax=Bordetella sp. N TaxID=1746199 RepID=UPI00070D6CAF|nr:glutathione-regulated potassium-efflux system oxidoreductase KefF [Bordetella sp. N]ALM82570.1 potassium transporter KefF [Bordetella sp. N]